MVLSRVEIVIIKINNASQFRDKFTLVIFMYLNLILVNMCKLKLKLFLKMYMEQKMCSHDVNIIN